MLLGFHCISIYCQSVFGQISHPLGELLLGKVLCSPSERVQRTQSLLRGCTPQTRGRISANGVCGAWGPQLLKEQIGHKKSKSVAGYGPAHGFAHHVCPGSPHPPFLFASPLAISNPLVAL